ncbi:hydrogenase maturation protease [Altericista sp. CCNU0014]|uniref:hydrogenase maturation protease n=1 Tax=Altericista sp. CCNU0014 TaxID=3082949 RepID=UPI00384AAE3F
MKTLAIGYGNSLRGDDGVGPWVADRVAAWNLPDVRSLSVHQLTPELAAEMAEAEVVFFIDACTIAGGRTQARLEPVASQKGRSQLDHLWSPSVLLHLANTLYDADPAAYQILIPAIRFDYGAPLSAIALEGAAWSLETLKDYIANPRSTRWKEALCTKSG